MSRRAASKLSAARPPWSSQLNRVLEHTRAGPGIRFVDEQVWPSSQCLVRPSTGEYTGSPPEAHGLGEEGDL